MPRKFVKFTFSLFNSQIKQFELKKSKMLLIVTDKWYYKCTPLKIKNKDLLRL